MTAITLVGAGEYTDLETLEQESYLRFRSTEGSILSLPCTEAQMRAVLAFLSGETTDELRAPPADVPAPSPVGAASVPGFDEDENEAPVTLRPLAKPGRDPSPFAGRNEDL